MKKYKVSQYMNKRNINKLSKMKVIKALGNNYTSLLLYYYFNIF